MNLIVLIDKLLINLCIEYNHVLLLQLTEAKITIFLSVGILEHSPLLDLMLTTDETLVNKMKVVEIFNRSDHQIIRWTLSVGAPMMEQSRHRTFNYFKADYDLVKLKMRGKDLERRTKDASVKESWNLLKKSLNEVIEETIQRAVKMVKKRPWVTRKVQKKRRAKQRAWRKYSTC